MILRNGNFVYTTKIRPGKVAVLKNDLTVIGVENELEAYYSIFKASRTPQELMEQEDSIMDTYDELINHAEGQQKASIDELFDAFMEHVSMIEKRAFESGYLTAKKEECPVATTEHSVYMAR